jgi:hypothetical protein
MAFVCPDSCWVSVRQLPFTGEQGKAVKTCLVFLVLTVFSGYACSQSDYTLNLKVSPSDLFGLCNSSKLNGLDLGEYLRCAGNFVSPVVPNPVVILDPVSGEALNEKVNAINVFKIDLWAGDIGGILTVFFNIPKVAIFTVLEVLNSAFFYLIVFGFRFLFVYTFYVSLGFQSVLLIMDQNSRGLNDVQRIQFTVFFMALATIVILMYGGDWIAW